VPLLLYVDGLILVTTSAAGLQKQLDALASFCDQRQLTVNLGKTKVVIFEAQRSHVADFVLNGVVVERWESYNTSASLSMLPRVCPLGQTFWWQGNVCYAAAVCTLGHQDPALQCKLFDTLVLPILSYAGV